MNMENQIQLLTRCLGHVGELEEIYTSGRTSADFFARDLRGLERLITGLVSGNRQAPPPPPSGREVLDGWVGDLVAAYRNLGGGKASHLRLYAEVSQIRRKAGRSLPLHYRSIIRPQ